MSADVLRSASTRIRHDIDFGQQHGDPGFLAAVADWLDREAALHDTLEATAELLSTASRGLGGSELRIQFTDTGDGMAASTMPQALAVARAYLGTEATL